MKYFLIFTSALLVSCSVGDIPTSLQTAKYVLHSEIINNEPLIHESNSVSKTEKYDNKWLSFVDDINNFIIAYPADYPKEKPIFMSNLSIQHSSSNCSPQLTGASITQSISKDSSWGKVDFFEQYAGESGTIDYEGMRPFCAGPSESPHRYALCSQKNGKTVVICIEQMTDNPDLAEEIFSTFRWTK